MCAWHPKWLYIAFPVARWLDTEGTRGHGGRRLRRSAVRRLRSSRSECCSSRSRRASLRVVDRLAVSSDFHPYFFAGEMRRLFRRISMRAFGRRPADFTLEDELGRAAVAGFCDRVDT